MPNHTENLSAEEIAGDPFDGFEGYVGIDPAVDAIVDLYDAPQYAVDEAEHAYWDAELAQMRAEAIADAELAHWDDDPSPYEGTYSEE